MSRLGGSYNVIYGSGSLKEKPLIFGLLYFPIWFTHIGAYRDINSKTENQLEKNMETQIETGFEFLMGV